MGKEGERAARPHIKYIIKSVLKGHIVLFIAVIAAAITCFFVSPDAKEQKHGFRIMKIGCGAGRQGCRRHRS